MATTSAIAAVGWAGLITAEAGGVIAVAALPALAALATTFSLLPLSLAALCVAAVGRAPPPFIAALAAGTIVGAAATRDATAVTLIAATVAALAAEKTSAQPLLLAEATAILLLVTFADFEEHVSHLTWWGMTALAVYDGVAALTPGLESALAPAGTVLAATITGGVAVMSALKCGVLDEAFHTNGPALYTVGNAYLHYYPLARALNALPAKRKQWKTAFPGAVVVATYTTLNPPTEVYRCPKMAGVGALLPPLVATGVALALTVASR
jgi:hypothetical protein